MLVPSCASQFVARSRAALLGMRLLGQQLLRMRGLEADARERLKTIVRVRNVISFVRSRLLMLFEGRRLAPAFGLTFDQYVARVLRMSDRDVAQATRLSLLSGHRPVLERHWRAGELDTHGAVRFFHLADRWDLDAIWLQHGELVTPKRLGLEWEMHLVLRGLLSWSEYSSLTRGGRPRQGGAPAQARPPLALALPWRDFPEVGGCAHA